MVHNNIHNGKNIFSEPTLQAALSPLSVLAARAQLILLHQYNVYSSELRERAWFLRPNCFHIQRNKTLTFKIDLQI